MSRMLSPKYFRSVVCVHFTVYKKECSLFCRVCKSIPRCWCSASAVWARCSPPTGVGAGADGNFNRIATGRWIHVSIMILWATPTLWALRIIEEFKAVKIQEWRGKTVTLSKCSFVLFWSRLTLPLLLPSTWLTDTRWTELQRRSSNVTATWTSSSITRESVTVAPYWTPTFPFSGTLWKRIILGLLPWHKVNNAALIWSETEMVWNILHKFFLSFPALLPSMVHRRSGHIVAISSVQGKIAIPYRSACKFPLINPSASN